MVKAYEVELESGLKIPPCWTPCDFIAKCAAMQVLFPHKVQALGVIEEPMPPPSVRIFIIWTVYYRVSDKIYRTKDLQKCFFPLFDMKHFIKIQDPWFFQVHIDSWFHHWKEPPYTQNLRSRFLLLRQINYQIHHHYHKCCKRGLETCNACDLSKRTIPEILL